jgi:hypothetical protein
MRQAADTVVAATLLCRYAPDLDPPDLHALRAASIWARHARCRWPPPPTPTEAAALYAAGLPARLPWRGDGPRLPADHPVLRRAAAADAPHEPGRTSRHRSERVM